MKPHLIRAHWKGAFQWYCFESKEASRSFQPLYTRSYSASEACRKWYRMVNPQRAAFVDRQWDTYRRTGRSIVV